MPQGGNDSAQGDSTSCSGKSSDDSGLSVTPDYSNPSPYPPTAALASAGGPGEGGGVSGVNWAGVPSEVVHLLAQQDAQLKVLQAQIQQLLSQQGGSAPSQPTPSPSSSSSADSTPSTVRRETCSTAVNTTLLEAESPWGRPATAHCVSVQTSPQKPAHHPRLSHHDPQTCPSAVPSHDAYTSPQRLASSPFSHDNAAHTAGGNPERVGAPAPALALGTPYREEAGSAGQTPSEIRHQGAVQLSSTQREDGMVVPASSFHSDVSQEQPSPAR